MATIPSTAVSAGRLGPWLAPAAAARLGSRVDEALRRARRLGAPVLAGVSTQTSRPVDPSAVVLASRDSASPWFCLEQPDRDRSALAARGSVLTLEADGPDRFAQISRRWQAAVADAVADPIEGPPGAGLTACGGFAFASDGGGSPAWSGFAAASLLVPSVSFARSGSETWISVNASVEPDDTRDGVLDGVAAQLAALQERPPPLLDPAPAGEYRVRSTMPPAHYEEAVARAVSRIRAGEFEKVVLARDVEAHAPVDHDPAAVLGVLREEFPSCFVFAVGRGEATFLGASPELLVRREGQRASTVALAGSIRRSADPAVDDHLGEQLLQSAKDRHENAIVARRITRTLGPHAVWVTAAPDPALVRVANIQHLARPIRAQLARPLGAVELAGLLHPTPAVGAEPGAVAATVIPALEGLDRGWYAGPIGWTDAAGDGEFCVALRCALVRGGLARCYAGCGIVGDSDPAAELAETEVKLQALLPLLAG